MKAQINEMANISDMYARITEQMSAAVTVRRKNAGKILPVRPERELHKAAKHLAKASYILKRMIEKDFHNDENSGKPVSGTPTPPSTGTCD